MANIIRRRQETAPSVSREWDPWRMMNDLLRWDPFREMGFIRPGVEEGQFLPTFDVRETKDAYIFKADLPGVKESDLDISITGNRLTVSGKREAEEKQEGDTWYAYERSYGSFTRSFTLPEGIDPDHVRAELKEGVLALHVPKRPEVQPKRVQLKSGSEKEKAKA